MAPEIVRRVEYEGKPVDIWSLGILLYALLCGCFPFRAKAYPDLYRRIARGTFQIPEELSAPVKDLLKQLLTVDPVTRITAHVAMRHSWLQVQLINAPNMDKLKQEMTVLISDKPQDDLDEEVINELMAFGMSKEEIIRLVLTKTHCSASTLYYLLLDVTVNRRRAAAKKHGITGSGSGTGNNRSSSNSGRMSGSGKGLLNQTLLNTPTVSAGGGGPSKAVPVTQPIMVSSNNNTMLNGTSGIGNGNTGNGNTGNGSAVNTIAASVMKMGIQTQDLLQFMTTGTSGGGNNPNTNTNMAMNTAAQQQQQQPQRPKSASQTRAVNNNPLSNLMQNYIPPPNILANAATAPSTTATTIATNNILAGATQGIGNMSNLNGHVGSTNGIQIITGATSAQRPLSAYAVRR